jgi:sugar (pentulose or hexulose) kinase
MRNSRHALAALNFSLAIQTMVALDRAGLKADTEVFTEGGFRKNAGYNAALASALGGEGGGRAYLTDISEATALGAAMTAAAALEGIAPDSLGDRFDIEYRKVRPMEALGDFARYRAEWLALVAGKGGRA